MSTYIEEFPDFPSLLQKLELPRTAGCTGKSSDEVDAAFTGDCHSLRDALTRAVNGWPEAVAKMQDFSALAAGLVGRVEIVRPDYALCGGTVDVTRYVVGEPFCFRRPRHEHIQAAGYGKVARVMLNTGALQNVSTNTMIWRGVCALVITDLLERSGRPTELWIGAIATDHGHRKLGYRCFFKAAGAPFNLQSVSFVFAHPAMHRRIVFGLRERAPAEWLSGFANDGYGATTQFDDADDYDVYIPGLRENSPEFSGPKPASDYIREHLTRLGVTAAA